MIVQEAILRMKRADWMRPLLELLEGQARRAGQAGLSSGQKALAAHLFEIIINEVSLSACIPFTLNYKLKKLPWILSNMPPCDGCIKHHCLPSIS